MNHRTITDTPSVFSKSEMGLTAHSPYFPAAMGLDAMNPPAFAAMGQCGHRVASIVVVGKWFMVKTLCTSGVKNARGESCRGTMQFSLNKRSIRFFCGEFVHHKECTEETGRRSNIPKYASSVADAQVEHDTESRRKILYSARQWAEAYQKVVAEKYEASVKWTEENGGDITNLLLEKKESQSLLDGIAALERQVETAARDLGKG